MAENKNRKTGYYPVAAVRYARVLKELGISQDAVRKTAELFEQSEELREALTNPVIGEQEKHAVIDRIFPAEMRSYLKIATDNGKIGMIEDIASAYEEQMRTQAGVVTARLWYVTPPSDTQKEKMEAWICRMSGAGSVHWEMEEAPALIDGFVLQVNGREYDYSMQGRLKRLEETLTRR